MAGYSFQQELEFVDAEWLRHIVVGSVLHRLYGRLHRTVTCHDDHNCFRPAFLNAAEGVQSACSGKTQVQQDRIKTLGFESTIGLLRGVRYIGRISQRNGDFTAGLADCAFVVNDEKVKEIGGLNLRSGTDGTHSC